MVPQNAVERAVFNLRFRLDDHVFAFLRCDRSKEVIRRMIYR